MLCVALKPTHAFHIVVARVMTGETCFMLASTRDLWASVSFLGRYRRDE
jgi:hypothetical protein